MSTIRFNKLVIIFLILSSTLQIECFSQTRSANRFATFTAISSNENVSVQLKWYKEHHQTFLGVINDLEEKVENLAADAQIGITFSCQSDLSRYLTHYEQKMITCNSTFLEKQFVGLDKRYIEQHKLFKRIGHAASAQNILRDRGLIYDPQSNPKVRAPRGDDELIIHFKNENQCRFFWWLWFFEAVAKGRVVYSKQASYIEKPPSHIALLVWWEILEFYQQHGYSRIYVAMMVSDVLDASNAFIQESKLFNRKDIQIFLNCFKALKDVYVLPTSAKWRTENPSELQDYIAVSPHFFHESYSPHY